MELEIAADTPLDSVTFRISPLNRYDAFICRGDKEEILGCGPTDDLILHLPQLKDSYCNGSCSDFKLQLHQNPADATWFTKATLMRFLHLIESGDALRKSISIKNEMSQLEETRLFHLSLYAKNGNGTAPSDDSKNELLRAMDLRLTAVQEDLFAAFNQAVGSRCSLEELTDLEFFCEQFEMEDLRNLLRKLLDLVEGGQLVDLLDSSKSAVSPDSRSDSLKDTDRGELTSLFSHLDRPVKYNASPAKDAVKYNASPAKDAVKYNASPAKAAEIERQSSTESEESSYSSEDRPLAERSRPLTKSATPRRSASPMRRIQIGRSGSRRASAITIKSLNSFPVREKALSYHKNTAPNDDAEVPEQSAKRTEVNVTRMSVQDAISLFESKQRDQTTDVQKRSLVDTSANVQKSVLRRWSSSVGETSARSATQDFPKHIQDTASISDNNPIDFDEGTSHCTGNQDVTSTSAACESAEAGLESGISGKHSPDPYQADISVSRAEETIDRLDSAEWNRRKEAELNQMLMKFMHTTQTTNQNVETAKSKGRNPRPVQKGGQYDQYKERKDVKLRGENAVKKSEKQGSSRMSQKIINKTKAEVFSKDVSAVGKINSLARTQKNVKSTPQALNVKREYPNPALSKKASPKPSPLPATRKSWPSTPSPRTAGTSPAKLSAGVTSSGSTASRQKSQSPASVSRPIPKVERSHLRQKDVKKYHIATKKSLKGVDENKRQEVVSNTGTMSKKKLLKSSDDNVAAKIPAKPGPRSKATKKSSVVPLDSKPTARKGPKISPASSPNKAKNKMVPLSVDDPVTCCIVPVQVQKDAALRTVSDLVIHPAEMVPLLQENDAANLEPQTDIDTHPEGGERDNSSEMLAEGDGEGERMPDSLGEIQPEEEPAISPSTWAEDDNQDMPSDSAASQTVPPANPAAMVASSGPRVRHSLSQMLLEETSEPDIIEWGNAENPPAIVYQKDAPKGLKRLLKFARKSRDVNQAGWSISPYTSEGEDDGEESKSFGKRSAEDLRKLALHARRYEGYDRNMTDSEPLSARSNTSSSSVQSWSKFNEGHGPNNKATRSFFSLSAFRGNKAADTKLR